MHAAVIDIQCYQSDDPTFIVKELAIVDVTGQQKHWMFKPPSYGNPYSPPNRWVYRNLHGINWEDGDMDYSEFDNVLKDETKNYTYLYVKGVEKSKFLGDIMEKTVYNLQDFGCPSLKQLCKQHYSTKCDYHCGTKYNCALHFSKILVHWLLNNYSKVDFTNSSVREKSFSGWKSTVSPELLAFNGYIKIRDDCVQCIYCGLQILEDVIKECPCKLHSIHNQNCILLKKHGIK